MARLGRFDADLEMFVDDPHDVIREQLRFLRWLGEHGLLEHGLAGPPSGEYAVVDTHTGVARQEAVL